MKILSAFAGLAFTLVFTINAYAQKIKVTEGSIDAIKNETVLNFEFTYDNMKVGKFDKEEDYVVQKKEEYNKKEAGRGDTWAKDWVDDRHFKFEPKFEELFAKYGGKSKSKDAKYTMIFKTNFTEPGYNNGVWRKPAQIDGDVWIVETANKSNVIAKMTIEKSLGTIYGSFDFDTGVRIMEAYAKAGKELGIYISK